MVNLQAAERIDHALPQIVGSMGAEHREEFEVPSLVRERRQICRSSDRQSKPLGPWSWNGSGFGGNGLPPASMSQKTIWLSGRFAIAFVGATQPDSGSSGVK